MTNYISLNNLRQQIDQTWVIVLFACIYLVSQISILDILGPLIQQAARVQWNADSLGLETRFAKIDNVLIQHLYALADSRWIRDMYDRHDR